MKKILILVPNLKLQGGVASFYNTLNLGDEENINYFFVTKVQKQFALLRVFTLTATYCRFFFKILIGNYKIIHLNPSLSKKSFFRDSVFIIISKILNRKIIISFHGWQDDFERKIKNNKLRSHLFRLSYAKADKFIVLSKLFKEKLIRLGVSQQKNFSIETTVADSCFLKDFDLKMKFYSFENKINILFLSRIEKEKGIYIAIDSFNIFLNRLFKKETCLIIAGDGSELIAAKKYVENLNLPNIFFLGNVTGESKKKVLSESHIMLFPSYSEGLPNCILEGMLYGMPIVSRTVGGIPDVIRNGDNGYLSDSFQPEIFAGFLSTLTSEAETYKRVSLNNHTIALEKYTTEKVRERILNIYREFN